jgi:hypothetical protein
MVLYQDHEHVIEVAGVIRISSRSVVRVKRGDHRQ